MVACARTGRETHVQHCMVQLLHRIAEGAIDTTFLISHRLSLDEVAEGYRCFRDQPKTWTRVVMRP